MGFSLCVRGFAPMKFNRLGIKSRMRIRKENMRMVTWKTFAAVEPTLAQTGSQQLFQFGVGLAYLATIRADGSPRLHPVCPVLSNDRLFVFVLPASPKRQDLEKDGRYALQAYPQPRPDSDEFFLSGRAQHINDPELKSKVLADAQHPATQDEILFELLIDRAMLTTWEGFGTPDYHSKHIRWKAQG